MYEDGMLWLKIKETLENISVGFVVCSTEEEEEWRSVGCLSIAEIPSCHA